MNAVVSSPIAFPRNVIIPEADPALINGVAGVLEVAREFIIDSREMYDMAATELRGIMGRKKRLEDARVSMKAPVLLAGRNIDGFFNPLITTLEEAERVYKRGMLTFDNAERIRRQEEERQAQVAAAAERKRIEDEAARVAAEVAERERQEGEALAAELRASGEDDAAEEALRDSQAAADFKADEIIQTAAVEAQTVTAMATPVEVQRNDGIATRENWVAEITDADALIKAAAGGDTMAASIVKRALEESGAKVLRPQARALKKALNDVPGIRCFNDPQLAVRGAR